VEKDTRSIIIERALRLFSQRGFDAVGIQEVALESAITKPAIYYHFGSKQGLLEEIVRLYGGGLTELFREAAVYRHDILMNLRGLFHGSLRFAAGQPGFWRLMLSLFSSPPDSPAYSAGFELRRSLLGILETLFKRAVPDHGNMRGRQKIYAETFLGLLETFGRLSIHKEIVVDDALEQRIVHQYMHGIFS
jgi:TetR/AcrR family transcriptional regulator